jgi:hypothetical protein
VIQPGAEVELPVRPEGIIITPKYTIAAACGFLKGGFSLAEDLIAEHRKERLNE